MAAKQASPLTTKRIENARPRASRYEISDGGTGLRVRVGPSGAKVFVWYAPSRRGAARRVVSLGHFWPEPREGFVTLGDARKKLVDLKAHHQGGTLVEGLPMEGSPATVSGLMDRWITHYVRENHRRPSVTEAVIKNDIKPIIGHRPLATLSPRAVAEPVERCVRRGAASHAGKVFSILKTALSWAVARGYLPTSPAIALQPRALGAVHNSRERRLDDKELAKVWGALESDDTPMMPVTRLAIRLLALTGVRSSALIEARRSEFDLAEAMWTVPPDRLKLRRKDIASAPPFVVPLVPDALALVRDLFALAPESPWLCPSPMSSASGRINLRTLHWPIEKMCERIGVKKWAPHDLRRTLRTWAGETGEDGRPRVDFAVAEALLQHKLPSEVARIYDRSTLLDARRRALEEYANHIRALTGKPPAAGASGGGKVIPIRRRGR